MSCNNWNNCGGNNNNWNSNCCNSKPAVSDANMNACYRQGYAAGFKDGYETGFRDGFWTATGCTKNTVMGDTDTNCSCR